ncbi:MAG: lytic transglycosylase domain-containing protein, partial [Desulfobulbaceae bacterium]|nr:lytic transglycosylase domain-containing protein [Desulfobulbaceae bacterium]
DNINGGTRYLRKMLNIFDDDLHLALAAYNAGPEVVKSIGRIPDIPETIEYVERVLRHYRRYQVASSSGTGG